MAIFSILTPEQDPRGVLNHKAESVTVFDSELQTLINQLYNTLSYIRAQFGFGRALAAPQVGISLKIIVVNLGATPFCLVNPHITWQSEEKHIVWDDCLSLPDKLARVQRSLSISVSFQDEFGRQRFWRNMSAEMSELILHEIDHLEGILMTDRAGVDGTFLRTNVARKSEHHIQGHRLSLEKIKLASHSISPLYMDTPCTYSQSLSDDIGQSVWLKNETINPLRCFKGRGAEFYLSTHAEMLGEKGITCASAGNWGMALAACCQQARIPLHVFIPQNANKRKLAGIRSCGAKITQFGADFDECKIYARAWSKAHNCNLIEDGREEAVSEGMGTIGIELLQTGEAFSAIIVPVGNGALINGISRWVKAASPDTLIIGVVPKGADSMYQSWKHLTPITRQKTETLADGLAVRVPVPEAIYDMKDMVDDIILVDDDELENAAAYAQDRLNISLEYSGAATIAGLFAWSPPSTLTGPVALILSGANKEN